METGVSRHENNDGSIKGISAVAQIGDAVDPVKVFAEPRSSLSEPSRPLFCASA